MIRPLLFGAAILLPLAAHAQQAPQFCMPASTAQAVAAALQQSSAVMALMQEAAQEPQRQAKVIADAVAKQKAEDEATSKTAPTPPKAP